MSGKGRVGMYPLEPFGPQLGRAIIGVGWSEGPYKEHARPRLRNEMPGINCESVDGITQRIKGTDCCCEIVPRMRGGESCDILEDRNRRTIITQLVEDPHEVPKSSRLSTGKSIPIASQRKVSAGRGSPGEEV